jgi:hypothetical protein
MPFKTLAQTFVWTVHSTLGFQGFVSDLFSRQLPAASVQLLNFLLSAHRGLLERVFAHRQGDAIMEMMPVCYNPIYFTQRLKSFKNKEQKTQIASLIDHYCSGPIKC